MDSQLVGTQNEYRYMRELARLPREFSYEELKMATNNFRPENKLGSGGSGSVFKAIMKDGTKMAVKRIERAEYGKQEFQAEISAIASVQHVHLVRLRGYCSHAVENEGAFFIVYDLLPNGSLDNWIFPKRGCPIGRFLSWKLRYKVAVDVARALVYLHHDCCPRILHLDVKPENILLDENLEAVLSDFGLSKLTKEDEREFQPKTIRGTAGYMAPEWYLGNSISDKCDIFSYGKVVMDLIFGQRYVCLDRDGNDIYIKGGNSAQELQTFHGFMWDKLTQKGLLDLIDKRLMKDGKVNEKEASLLVHTALCCLDEDPKKRPGDMREVLDMLEAGKPDGIRAIIDRFPREFFKEKVPKGTPGLLVIIVHEAYNIVGKYTTKDLYAQFSFRREWRETKHVKKDRNPKWEEEFSFLLEEAPVNDKLSVQVISSRTILCVLNGDEYLGRVFINLSDVTERKRTNEVYQLCYDDEPTNGKIHIELHWRTQ
ncbi:hypothetical protein GIB67_043021 [Kingdonia uniflora]|uniref:Protein kinase domain-containing protein n=1 Tax=Kingdonia uniflora TaxID=39325 RepID=A0A7J7NT28_9MAGN|nr:hypothetical protein GIB67_043021 [Kingdonia uniflora]